jgi:hypothetical protein
MNSVELTLHDGADIRRARASPAAMLAPPQTAIQVGPFEHQGRGSAGFLKIPLEITGQITEPPFAQLDAPLWKPGLQMSGKKGAQGLRCKAADQFNREDLAGRICSLK